ncbi:MAG: diguanylate cyclase [Pseudomonadales bacterium]
MAQEQNRTVNQHLTTTVHFDDRTALHLSQAFNQETSLEGLLGLIHSQLAALNGIHGLHYAHTDLGLDITLGRRAHHTADYNLAANEQELGTLTLYFPRRQHEAEIQTCEDLLSLAFTALRNHVEKLTLSQASPAAEEGLGQEEKADALVLVALDGYQQMRERDGDEWSQIVMSSVHSQIKEGLRQADGVYQISDDLVAVLLPRTTREQAHEVAQKIRVLVASLHLASGRDNADSAMAEQQLTVSMGISDAKLASTAEEVMANAKTALTVARDQGRNTIQAYDEALVSQLGIG